MRNATLVSVLAKAGPGLRLNEHMECDDGEIVFRHACKMGLEGIVSKRKDLPYRSGRSSDWLKMKNPACAAVKREAEEDWGMVRRGPRKPQSFRSLVRFWRRPDAGQRVSPLVPDAIDPISNIGRPLLLLYVVVLCSEWPPAEATSLNQG